MSAGQEDEKVEREGGDLVTDCHVVQAMRDDEDSLLAAHLPHKHAHPRAEASASILLAMLE